jgi:CRP/FNR family cyclic AMP-dependent transcriptional regulator
MGIRGGNAENLEKKGAERRWMKNQNPHPLPTAQRDAAPTSCPATKGLPPALINARGPPFSGFGRRKSELLCGRMQLNLLLYTDFQMATLKNTQTTVSCMACSVRSSGIFCDLDRPRLLELEQLRRGSIYPAGVIVFLEGDQPKAAYCVCSGRLKLSTCSPDGRSVILGLAGGGDVLGVRALLLGRSHDVTAETLERTQLSSIAGEDFLAFLRRNGDVSLRLAQRLSSELYEAYRQVGDAALKGSSERLTELLLALCQTQGEPTSEGISLRLRLSQEEMAQLVGTSRRSVTRALTQLRHLGIIEYRKSSILVHDRIALAKLHSS